jgi:predicted metalloendopeptidase
MTQTSVSAGTTSRSNCSNFVTVSDCATVTPATDAAPGSETQKIRDLYNSFMDEARLEERGLAPLAAPPLHFRIT